MMIGGRRGGVNRAGPGSSSITLRRSTRMAGSAGRQAVAGAAHPRYRSTVNTDCIYRFDDIQLWILMDTMPVSSATRMMA